MLKDIYMFAPALYIQQTGRNKKIKELGKASALLPLVFTKKIHSDLITKFHVFR